jgi:uncharacterized membrane protein YraQ (UPF0718 family)
MKKKMKKFLPIVVVAALYILLAIISFDTFKLASHEAGYYLKEMLEIMPIVFGLIVLIEVWLPRKVIEKHMGSHSGISGIVLAFLMGMLSAGPIYAAFPITGALYKKGASIKNVVIILSSWAVIKVPMLVNEAKFLGIKFMAIRWLLTIVVILIIATFMEILAKDKKLIV